MRRLVQASCKYCNCNEWQNVLFGTSTYKLINKIISCPFQAQNYIRSLPKMERKNFSEVFKGANPLGKIITLHHIKGTMLAHIRQCCNGDIY